MTVPVLITDLSTTALLNAPSGEDAPSTLDNIQRAHAAFIAKLRDESQTLASKDASGGYPGLTLFKLNLRNAADTFTSWLVNAATAARTWTMPDKDGTVAMTSDITGGASAGSFTTLAASENLNLTGLGKFITGDFSNATIANRLYFQSSTVNGVTDVAAIPNGTSTTAAFRAYNSSNLASASLLRMVALSSTVELSSDVVGAGTLLPIVVAIGGAERLRIGTAGDVTVSSAALLGYGVGAGGTVTQATSRTTGVTLNKPVGAIMLFTAAGSATPATFTVTNSLVAAADIPEVVCKSGTNVYLTKITAVAAGSFNVTFWTTGGTTSDTPVFNFSIGKGAIT